MVLEEQRKNEVGKKLMELAIDSVQQQKLSMDDMSLISSLISEHLPKATTVEEMVNFLDRLSTVWPTCSVIRDYEKGLITESAHQETVTKFESLMKERKVDEAIETITQKQT